jgi:hypothetical protein
MDVGPKLDTYETEGCPYYRVEVRDGDDAEAPLMGSYCGSRAPPHLTSQGSAMFVQIMVPHGGQVGTFAALYSVLSSGEFYHINQLVPEVLLFLSFAELLVALKIASSRKRTLHCIIHNSYTLIFQCEIKKDKHFHK